MTSVEESLLITVAAVGIAYGLLDLFAPGTAISWAVRSTSRARGSNRRVGEGFGRFIDRGASEPWNDEGARTRTRLIGVFLVLIMALTIASVLSIETT